MLTDQEVFDRVSTHLLTQMEKSISDDAGGCAYRGENGTKCAIGCLIDDDWYQPWFEGYVPYAISRSSYRYKENLKFIEEITTRVNANTLLMHDLQDVHDSRNPDDWRDALEDVATRFGLRGPTPLPPQTR